MRSSVPIVPKSEAKYLSFDVTTGTQRDADASETTLFNPRSVSSAAIAGQPCTLSRSARGPGVLAPTQIEVRCQGAEPVICRAEACDNRSEEHTSELQSLMRISYAVFCLKKKNEQKRQ